MSYNVYEVCGGYCWQNRSNNDPCDDCDEPGYKCQYCNFGG